MPLYIYSVSLETHKASFSDWCDETSLHYLPGTFWRNKRPIESNLLKWTNTKRGEIKEQAVLWNKELYSYGCCTCFIQFSPVALLVKESGSGKTPMGRTLSLPLSLPDFMCLSELVTWISACSSFTTLKFPEGNGFLSLKGGFGNPISLLECHQKEVQLPVEVDGHWGYVGQRERDVTFLWHVSKSGW